MKFLVLIGLFILPAISFTLAYRPKYVGISENNTFIWQIEYNENNLERYYRHIGKAPGWIDENVDLDEDDEAIKIVILDIGDKEKSTFGARGVKIIYNYYITENRIANDWKLEEKDETYAIFDDDEVDFFANLIKTGFSLDEDILETELPYFISNSMDWTKVKIYVEDYYQEYDYDKFRISIENGEYDFIIYADYSKTDDVGDWEYIYKYTKDGVLWFYEWKYYGRTIIKVELELGLVQEFKYWFILGAIALASLVTIIIIRIILKKLK